MIDRGVSPRDANELVDAKPARIIDSAIAAYDHLTRSKKLTNPGGFLAKAIRDEWQLKPPGLISKVDQERLVGVEAEEKPVQEARQRHEQDLVQAKLESLAPDVLEELRREAMAMARKQIGPAVKLREDSPVVEAFLCSLVQERYPETKA